MPANFTYTNSYQTRASVCLYEFGVASRCNCCCFNLLYDFSTTSLIEWVLSQLFLCKKESFAFQHSHNIYYIYALPFFLFLLCICMYTTFLHRHTHTLSHNLYVFIHIHAKECSTVTTMTMTTKTTSESLSQIYCSNNTSHERFDCNSWARNTHCDTRRPVWFAKSFENCCAFIVIRMNSYSLHAKRSKENFHKLFLFSLRIVEFPVEFSCLKFETLVFLAEVT